MSLVMTNEIHYRPYVQGAKKKTLAFSQYALITITAFRVNVQGENTMKSRIYDIVVQQQRQRKIEKYCKFEIHNIANFEFGGYSNRLFKAQWRYLKSRFHCILVHFNHYR